MVELNLGTNQLTKIPEDVSSLASLEVANTTTFEKRNCFFLHSSPNHHPPPPQSNSNCFLAKNTALGHNFQDMIVNCHNPTT